MRSRARAGVLGVCAAIAALAAPAAVVDASTVSAAQQAEEAARSKAEAQANGLLAAIPLPAGATRLTAEPGDDGGALAPAAPSSVPARFAAAAISWAVVAEPATSVLAYLKAHPFGGADFFNRFPPYAPQPALAHVGLAFPNLPIGELPELEGEVILLAAGPNQTDVEISAVAHWVGTPLTVPAGAGSLRITFDGVGPRSHRPHATRVITSARRIEAVRATLDRLRPAGRRVIGVICPRPLGTISLAFYAQRDATGEPLAVATVAAGGCGGAFVSVEGTEGPSLEVDGATSTILALTGLRVPRS
jgi:hypothetical protein